MFITTAVTQKGQITIPKKLREKIGINPYEKVKLSLGNGYLKVEPTEDILDLARKINIKKRTSVLKARDEFEKKYKRT